MHSKQTNKQQKQRKELFETAMAKVKIKPYRVCIAIVCLYGRVDRFNGIFPEFNLSLNLNENNALHEWLSTIRFEQIFSMNKNKKAVELSKKITYKLIKKCM